MLHFSVIFIKTIPNIPNVTYIQEPGRKSRAAILISGPDYCSS